MFIQVVISILLIFLLLNIKNIYYFLIIYNNVT